MELRVREYKFNDGEKKVEYVIPPTNTPFFSVVFSKKGEVRMVAIHQRVLEYHEAVVLMSLLCGVIKNEVGLKKGVKVRGDEERIQ